MAGENESNGQQQQRGSEQEQSKSFIGAVLGKLGAAYNAVMRGGEVQAFGRQGIDELGQALKAFPDSIQAHAEPGGVFEPLHSDIEQAREQYAPRADLPSPGDIARGTNFRDSERGQSHMRGQTQSTERADERNNGPYGPTDQSRDGQQMAQVGPWTQRELERRGSSGGGGGQNEPFVARILPDEQREQKEEIERGRGR